MDYVIPSVLTTYNITIWMWSSRRKQAETMSLQFIYIPRLCILTTTRKAIDQKLGRIVVCSGRL